MDDIGKIVSINISKTKKVQKVSVPEIEVKEGYGLIGDAHAGIPERHVSLLSIETVEEFKNKKCPKLKGEIGPGAFAENITTKGINLKEIKVGEMLKIGDVLLKVTKIGKECHTKCAIYKKVGDCIMPKEGIFCEVIKGGKIKVGDTIERVKV